MTRRLFWMDRPASCYLLDDFYKVSGLRLNNNKTEAFWISANCLKEEIRTYEHTYASTDCTGGVGATIKRKGGVSQAYLGKSTSLI